jgi:hypothetical protein
MRLAASIAVLLAMSPGGTATNPPPQESAVRLAVEGRSNATPWIAAQGAFVAVAWGATPPSGGADVYVAVSRDSAATFERPVRVNSRAGTARLGGELPPRIALSRSGSGAVDPVITVVWGAKETTTEIRSARSTDGGQTFTGERSLSSPGAAGDRGWHAVAIDERGTAHVMWLDHRGLATRPRTAHDHHSDGADMAQFSSLYYWDGTTEQEVAKGVCYCCKLAAGIGADGSLFAAWRHVYKGNIRDIAFVSSRDGGRTFSAPSRVSEDNWQLAGCPDDGPAVAVGPDGVMHLVWPTVIGGATPRGALFYASTRDGRSFTPRQPIATLGGPKPSHPQIAALDDGRLTVAWDEVVDGVRRAAARSLHITDGTLRSGDIVPIGSDTAGAYPVLAVASRGLLAAWTRGVGGDSVINVTRLP